MSDALVPIFDMTRLDGWFHLYVNGWDVPRGPLGVLGYLPFVAIFWLVPARASRPFLVLSSVLLTYVLLGPAFVGFSLALIVFYYVATLALTQPDSVIGQAGKSRIGTAAVVLHLPYVWLLFNPRPGFLPPLGDTTQVLTNYLHWAGLAYLHLKAVATVIDRLEGRIETPRLLDYLTYMLFAPTFKMGPLYRYDRFLAQLPQAKENIEIRQGLYRIGIGFLRLGIMLFLLSKQIEDNFFSAPETLKYREVFFSYLCVPFQLYFWLAGYCDISVGMGRLMGFKVPEQFRGPWFVSNIGEFWKRWSITLGAWLYDYPFRAMVANGFWRSACFVLAFLYCGLWHGLFTSYVVWGVLQGAGLATYHAWSRWWRKRKKKKTPAIQLLHKLRLIDTRLSWWLAWLLLINYQILTIAIASDLDHAGTRFLPVLLGLVSGK